MRGKFGISVEDLSKLIESYKTRTGIEDMEEIEKLGGIEGIVKKLNSNDQFGILYSDAERVVREEYFGNNRKEPTMTNSFFDFVLEALGDTMIIILIICAAVEIIVGVSPYTENPGRDWIDGIGILLAVVVVSLTASITNYNKECKFQELYQDNQNLIQTTVKRNGRQENIKASEILPGDIIKLEYGAILQSDGLIIEARELKLDESAITGESKLVSKMEYLGDIQSRQTIKTINNNSIIPSAILLSGTSISSGSGWYLALAVGKNSSLGKMQALIEESNENEEDSKTPLEEKLEAIADYIGKFGLIAAILTLVVLFIKLFALKYHQLQIDSSEATEDLFKQSMSIVILSISILVMAIPEGLPLSVTLSLAFSVKKMMEQNNLVRKIEACETMGGANYILTDKTGTITTSEMSVSSFYNNQRRIDLADGILRKKCASQYIDNSDYRSLVFSCLIETIDKDEGKGNQTDKSISAFLKSMNINFNTASLDYFKIPFDSTRKKTSTILQVKSELENKYRIYTKGACEGIINSISYFTDPTTGKVTQINSKWKDEIENSIKYYNDQCQRNIILCYRDLSQKEYLNWNEKVDDHFYSIEEDKGLIAIGLLSISDEIKQDVHASIKECQKAGINVIMVTGDNVYIAAKIAEKAGIIDSNENINSQIIVGKEFMDAIEGIECKTCSHKIEKCSCPLNVKEAIKRNLTSDDVRSEQIVNIGKFENIIRKIKVVGRATPEHKYALTLGLKKLGNVVAVTGDGTNDAPALAKADVGFCMGIRGTDCAREASDIIIMDDSFSSIVVAVTWGRTVFANIRKFLQFQLSVNIAAVFIVFITSLIGTQSPLTAVQILWLNMIMDSLGSLALSTSLADKSLLEEKPYSRKESIITVNMWKHIIIQALFLFVISLVVYLSAPYWLLETDPSRIGSIMILFNCFGNTIPPEHSSNPNLLNILDGQESNWKNSIFVNQSTSCPFYNSTFDGMQVENLHDAFKWYNSVYGNTTHMTLVFNIFVLYVLFNQINCRILADKTFNILSNLQNNLLFILVFIIEMLLQIFIVQYGGVVFKCIHGGLSLNHWIFCIILASSTFLVSAFCKLIKFEKNISDMFSFLKLAISKSEGTEKDKKVDSFDLEENEKLV